MRVLFLSSQPFFQWRGSPIRVAYDVRAIAEQGHQVDLLTLPIGEDVDIPGVRVIRVANVCGRKNIPIGPSIWKIFYDLAILFKGWSLIRRQKYDVVHGIEDAGAVAVCLARRARAKCVFEKHSDPGSYKGGALLGMVMSAYRSVERWIMKRSDAIIGTGPALVAQAKEVNPTVPAFHIPDIPSSLVEPEDAKAAEIGATLRKSADEVIALYVGSFASYQGIDLLFASMKPAVEAQTQLRFVIIGGSPSEIADREAGLRSEGIESRVSMIGKVPPDELPHYLRAADILLSPRIAGSNTPLKLLDYLKAGRAIVATDLDANRLILDEETAVLAAPQDEEFANAIAKLAAEPETRDRLAGKGRSLIDDLYNYGYFKDRLGECYQGLNNG